MATNPSNFFLAPPKKDPDTDIQQPDRADQADKTDESEDSKESKPFQNFAKNNTFHSAASSPSLDTYFDDALDHGMLDGDSDDETCRPVLRRRHFIQDLRHRARATLDNSEIVKDRVREAVRGLDLFHRNPYTGRQRSSSGQFPNKTQSKTSKNGSKPNASLSAGEYEIAPSGSSKAAGKGQLSKENNKLSPRAVYTNPTFGTGLASSSRPPQIPPLPFQAQPLDAPCSLGRGRPSETEDRAFRAQPESQTVNMDPETESSPKRCRRDQSPSTFSGKIGRNMPPRSTSSHSGENAPDTETNSRARGSSESEVVTKNKDKTSVCASVPRPRGLIELFAVSSSTDAVTTSSTRASKAYLGSSSMTTVCSAVPDASQTVPRQSNWGLSRSSFGDNEPSIASSVDGGARITDDIAEATATSSQGSEFQVNEPSIASSVDGGAKITNDIAEAMATPFQDSEEPALIRTNQPQEDQQQTPGVESLENNNKPRPRLPNFTHFEMTDYGLTHISERVVKVTATLRISPGKKDEELRPGPMDE
ncbi:hypothetical protein BDW69DRAFT_189026 [Aspergillus filifer]